MVRDIQRQKNQDKKESLIRKYISKTKMLQEGTPEFEKRVDALCIHFDYDAEAKELYCGCKLLKVECDA